MAFTAFIKRFLTGATLCGLMVLGLSFVAPQTAYAQQDGCANDEALNVGAAGISGGAACAQPENGAENLFGPTGVFRTVTNIMLFLIGAIAVIMLIVGGIQYVMSGGESSKVTSAKNTILYAIIGIVVAFLAYAAVQFVTSQLDQGQEGYVQPKNVAVLVK